MTPTRVLFCFAVREEVAPFRARAPRDVEILVVGMGQAQARQAIERRLASDLARPGLVLTCGFAGGLAPDLGVGTVLFDVDAGLEALSARLRAAGARAGRVFCADRVAVTVAEKSRLRAETGADAVEMESGVIRECCRVRGIPSATIRVISDAARHALPVDFNALMTADHRLSFGRLAWAIVRSPRVIIGLRELQRRCALAAANLADVLVAATG